MIKYTGLSILSEKIKVIIIGGGRAAYIKAKTFLNDGCKVYVLSKDFIKEFENLKKDVTYIKGEYEKRYILDKHIVVIALDDDNILKQIIKDGDENFKIYLNCKNYKEGLFVMPTKIESENINAFINIKNASPKTSLFIGDKIKKLIDEFDDFAFYAAKVREEYKNTPYKDMIMEFVNTDYFYECFKRNTHEIVLKDFIGGFKVEP